MVDQEDNEMLKAIPSESEIKEAIWELNPDSAAGPDGFNGQFFKSCWEIIHVDLVCAVQDFFCGANIPNSWSSANIVLLPKIKNPDQCNNFRPISLSNFNQKIITKVIANRMGKILPKIISPHQTGFIKGRNIHDNIMLAQEMMHKLEHKTRGNNVVMKLDMAKAYDRVSWLFFIQVLRKFGFCETFIDMVWRLLSNCFYSVIVNGACSGYFKSSRGLKQGDPLSPALFIISSEVLARNLQNEMKMNPNMHFYQPRGTQLISHLSFADDIIIFCNGSKNSVIKVMDVLHDYERWSGQLLSTNKCTFAISKKTPRSRVRMIKLITGFKSQEMPLKYLGCPIFHGRAKIIYFNDLVESIRSKIAGWHSNFLNQAGKLILIKHVLSSIPIHICSAICPPVAVLQEIDKIFSNCFWNDNLNNRKQHWISWDTCCSLKEEGGLGLRKLKEVIKVQSFKLYWKLLKEDTLWGNFMKAKYNKEWNNPSNKCANASGNWRRIRDIREEASNFITTGENNITWNVSPTGSFSAKHTWEAIRKTSNRPMAFKFIWINSLPMKVSIFMWKLMHNRLALDKNLKSKGIQLASKCRCCDESKEENLNHLFFESSPASSVWKHYTRRVGVKPLYSNFSSFLKSWWKWAKTNTEESTIFHTLPAMICWGLWKSRNKIVFEERGDSEIVVKKMEAKVIIEAINREMNDLNRVGKFSSGVKAVIADICDEFPNRSL